MRVDDIRNPVTYTGIRLSNGTTYASADTFHERKYYRSRSDVTKTEPVNGFRKPTPYSCTLVERTVGRMGFEAQNTYYNPPRTASYRGGATPNNRREHSSAIPVDYWNATEALVDRSVIGARNSVANRTAAFGETIAEARSTLAGLAGNARTVTAVCDDLINTRWKAALRKLKVKPGSPDWSKTLRRSKKGFKSFSDAWLTYWFGLAPIVDDMVQGMAFFSGDEVFRRLRVKGSAYVPLPEDEVTTQYGGDAYIYSMLRSQYTEKKKFSGGVYTSLWYTIDSKKLRELTKFGLMDVPSTAWAMVPWSFAVDWVLPVSQVLKSLTATVGLTYLGGSSTRFVRSEVKFVPGRISFYQKGSQLWEDLGSYMSFPDLKGLRMSRQVYKTEPNPVDLWVKDPLDAWTATTALSLLAQRLKFFRT